MKKLAQSILSRLFAYVKTITWPLIALGFAGVLLMATMGQAVLVTQLSTTLGIWLYVLAILLFLVILRAVTKCPPPSDQDRAFIRHYTLPFVFILASLLLSVFVVAHVDNPQTAGKINYDYLFAWILSIAFFGIGVLVAIRWQFPGLRSLGQSFKRNKWEVILVISLFLLALFLRIYKLDQYPYPMIKDEASVGIEAQYILHGNFTNLFQTGWAEDSLLNSLPDAASNAIFGNTIFGVRFVSAIIGAFTVLFLYFLARLIFDKLTAFLAALCLLAIPPDLHFSRLGVSNITVGFWAVLVFWITYRAIKSGRTSDYFWAGLLTGLPLYSYTGSRLISAIGAAMLGICILLQRGYLRKQWRNLLVYAVILIIVVAPTLYLTYLHPQTFLSRFRGDNIFSSHWLISQPIITGKSIPTVLLDQLLHSTMVFIYQPAWRGFYYSPLPFLLPVAAVLFVFGWVYSLFHINEPRHLLLQVWFWTIIILGSVIIPDAPNNERMIGSFPVAALFCAVGLVKLVELPKRMQLVSPRVLNGIAVCVMAVASLQGGYYYLVQYQQSRVFYYPSEEFEMEVSLYARTLGPDYNMYMLISMPLQVTHFQAHDFLIPEIQDQQLDTISPDVLQALPRDKGMLFFAIPTKLAEITEVAQYFPGGKWHSFQAHPVPGKPPMILYYSYQVPPGSITRP